MQKMRTLGEFIVEKQHDFPHASGELSSLLASIRLAAKIVNREINKAGLADIIGASGNDNIQGEEQQKLDLYANENSKPHWKHAIRCVVWRVKKKMKRSHSVKSSTKMPNTWC